MIDLSKKYTTSNRMYMVILTDIDDKYLYGYIRHIVHQGTPHETYQWCAENWFLDGRHIDGEEGWDLVEALKGTLDFVPSEEESRLGEEIKAEFGELKKRSASKSSVIPIT